MTTSYDYDVSARTATALREAMQRLLAGQSRHTDGQLTKANLGREADLSHATVHRAEAILREWDEAVAACGATTRQQRHHDDQIAELRGRLTDKTKECQDLRRQLEAAATVIATPHHENRYLRTHLDQKSAVIPVDFNRLNGDVS